MTAADKMRRHRLELERALADGISLKEARHRLFVERCARFERCGRRDEAAVRPAPVPLAPSAAGQPDDRPRFWWLDR